MDFNTLNIISNDGKVNICSAKGTVVYPKIGSVMSGSPFKDIATAVTIIPEVFEKNIENTGQQAVYLE